MGSQAAKTSAKSKPRSNKGGSRPGAGRKPKAVQEIRDGLNSALISDRSADPAGVVPRKARPSEEMRAALNSGLISEVVAGVVDQVKATLDHADAAMTTLRSLLDDAQVAPKDRIAAARELLNRTLGLARPGEKESDQGDEGEQVHIYIPDNGREATG